MYNPKIRPLGKQKEIVAYCDNLSDMISKMENQIIENDKLMKDTMNMFMKSFSMLDIFTGRVPLPLDFLVYYGIGRVKYISDRGVIVRDYREV